MAQKKVYDFPFDKVKGQVITALKKKQGRGTVADIVSQTGLPNFQVSSVLPSIVDDCRGELQVTDRGEILYHFPKGMASRKPGLGQRFLSGLGKVLAFLFKAWIVVMLVGYFVLFLLVMLIAILVAFALSFARRDDRDDGVGEVMEFYLVTQVIEFFMLLWLFSGDREYKVQKKKKPFFKAVFDFVFGVEEKPEIWEKREKRAFISFVQRNKGLISLEEIMVITGRNREEANALVSRLMLEYQGEPQVSDQGTLYYSFPELMKTSTPEKNAYILPEKDLIPFTRNPSSTNGWIAFLNGFNILFAIYFIAFTLTGGLHSQDTLAFVYQVTVALTAVLAHVPLSEISQAQTTVLVIFGLVPGVYSAFFFGIPLVRRLMEGKKNQKIKEENFSRILDKHILAHAQEVDLDQIQPTSEKNAPGKPGLERDKVKERLFRDFVSTRSVDVEEKGSQHYIYRIPDFPRETQDLVQVRQGTKDESFALGPVVFDSASDEKL